MDGSNYCRDVRCFRQGLDDFCEGKYDATSSKEGTKDFQASTPHPKRIVLQYGHGLARTI